MFSPRCALLSAVLGVLALTTTVRAQTDGVEPLARGPVHEAFANPVRGDHSAGRLIDREPPAPIEEVPADQKPDGDNVQWIPGYWAWDDARADFLWISGFWRVPPPGRSWVPGSWRQAANGWQWTAGFWASAEEPDLNYLPPPPETIETGPSVPAPSAEHVYVPGTWVYTSSRYAWRPGTWVVHRPGWVWVPACYRWSPAGYVFVAGYWDYPLASRGVLFAPVWIDRRVCYRPRWSFSPTIAVYDDALYGSLFVRRGCSHYYFGDYFEARYTSIGYSSWFSVGFGRGYSYDPLWSYYSVHYRRDPYWAPAIREVYVARYRGDIPRPPVTVVNNVTNINVNIVNNPVVVNKYPNIVKTTNITNVTNVNNTVVNIKNVNKTNVTNNVGAANYEKFTKMKAVSAAEKETVLSDSRKIRDVGAQRVNVEKSLVTQGAPTRSNDAPKSARLDLPKPKAPANVAAAGKAPPPPAVNVKPSLPTTSGVTTRPGSGASDKPTAPRTGITDRPNATGKPPAPLPPLDKPKPKTPVGGLDAKPPTGGTKPPVTLPPLNSPKPPAGNGGSKKPELSRPNAGLDRPQRGSPPSSGSFTNPPSSRQPTPPTRPAPRDPKSDKEKKRDPGAPGGNSR